MKGRGWDSVVVHPKESTPKITKLVEEIQNKKQQYEKPISKKKHDTLKIQKAHSTHLKWNGRKNRSLLKTRCKPE